jgi:hypothetical protein
MESFRIALDRLSRQFISDVVTAVESFLTEQRRQRTPVVRKRTAAIVRPSAPEPQRVVVTQFEIPVGRRRTRRPRVQRPAVPRTPPPAPKEQVVKFEVVPHPERANRRMVLTRLGSP